MELLAILTSVWTTATVTVAVAAGLGLGYILIGGLAVRPAYANGKVTPRTSGTLTAVMGALTGLVFYIGQAVAAGLEGDPAWPRVLSRYGLWVVYSLGMGVGLFARLVVDRRRRRRRLSAQAHAEVDQLTPPAA